jgi:molecular chaperone DnaJ
VAEACRECRGSGFVDGQRTVRVEVPAGVGDGARLRLTGLGESVGRRGSPGDLHVEIHTRPHPHLARAGDDLVYVTSVGVAGAVLGASMEVPLLEGGTERLDVPAGTQPGSEFRLKGLGANHLGRRGRGDMRVIVNVDVPTNLSNEEEDALREFARLRGEEHRQPARRRWGK